MQLDYSYSIRSTMLISLSLEKRNYYNFQQLMELQETEDITQLPTSSNVWRTSKTTDSSAVNIKVYGGSVPHRVKSGNTVSKSMPAPD